MSQSTAGLLMEVTFKFKGGTVEEIAEQLGDLFRSLREVGITLAAEQKEICCIINGKEQIIEIGGEEPCC